MKEEEMFREVLASQNRDWMPPDEEIYLRKIIRKDIKELIKMERMADYKGETTDSDLASDEESMNRRIEDKVMFGSDSDRDIDEMVMAKFRQQLANKEIEYASETDSEEYDEEGEEEGEEEQTEKSELEFDQGESQYNKEANDTDTDQINSSVGSVGGGDTSSQNDNDETPSDRKGLMEFEMVDLKKTKKEPVLKEGEFTKQFEVAGKVNQSAKKREKRKQKKAQEKELQAILEQRKRQQAEEKAKEDYLKAKSEGRQLPNQKQFVRKVIPKKTIVDEQGSWEVVDQKKSVLVEKTSDDEGSESD